MTPDLFEIETLQDWQIETAAHVEVEDSGGGCNNCNNSNSGDEP